MPVLDAGRPEHAQADERLRREVVVWLVTVRPDGQPQATPVWFLWDGESFLIYSQAGKPKLRNIAANPQVALHLRGTETGEDVAIFEGAAELPDDAPPADQVPGYVDKYRQHIEELGYSPATFAEDYSRPVRITPTRARIW